MIALLCFFLTLFASPFKPKTRLEAENGRPQTSADHTAAEGARSCTPHERGSLVLGLAISMVSNGSQCYHDYPSRDPRPTVRRIERRAYSRCRRGRSPSADLKNGTGDTGRYSRSFGLSAPFASPPCGE